MAEINKLLLVIGALMENRVNMEMEKKHAVGNLMSAKVTQGCRNLQDVACRISQICTISMALTRTMSSPSTTTTTTTTTPTCSEVSSTGLGRA